MPEEWTVLLVTYDLLEAEILKDLLESGDIPVQLLSAKVSPYPVNVGRMGEVKVMVREEDLEDAEEVLRRFREEPAETGNGTEELL
ncbi:MAG: DUF2007 domain-containing protein [Nitrospiraceae bacterium]|nr:DUF2007 domain-containing protein [Nitrospiraceae bacterium]